MPKGENMTRCIGTYDPESGFIVDQGLVKASHVQAALGIGTRTVWLRTLAACGVTPKERGDGTQVHWMTLDDAKRLVATARCRSP